MVYDPQNHTLDPVTGYARHADSGHIIGLEQAPLASAVVDPDWPKWVDVHDSHVVRKHVYGAPDSLSTPGWKDFHVGRDGKVQVLALNENDEKRASSEQQEKSAEPDTGDDIDPRILREVRAEFDRAAIARAEKEAKEAAEKMSQAIFDEARKRSDARREIEQQTVDAAQKAASESRDRLIQNFGDLGGQASARPVQVPSTVGPILGDQPQDIDVGVAGSAYAGAQAKASTERAEQMHAETQAITEASGGTLTVPKKYENQPIDLDHGKVLYGEEGNSDHKDHKGD